MATKSTDNTMPAKSDDLIKLSILCITYNHETFIRRALDSMLMQRADFNIEIIIGEDCSTDRTREICIEYQRQHPEIFKLLLNENNIGMIANFIQALKVCRGKYVALLEGDDYWTDPYKLQKQVDFLDANPDYVMCHHRYYNARNNKKTNLSYDINDTISVEDLAAGNQIKTLTCVFANILKELPEWYLYSPVGDYPLFMLLAQYGKIKFFDEPMAVHNMHHHGEWNKQGLREQLETIITVKELMYNRADFSENVRLILLKSLLDDNLDLVRELIKCEQTDEIPSILAKVEKNYSKRDLIEKLHLCQQEIIRIEKRIRGTYSFRIGKFFTKNLRKLHYPKAIAQPESKANRR